MNNRSSKFEVIDAHGNITEYSDAGVREYLRAIGAKGGRALKGTQAAIDRARKGGLACQAKRKENL
jgi:hypothetical protein